MTLKIETFKIISFSSFFLFLFSPFSCFFCFPYFPLSSFIPHLLAAAAMADAMEVITLFSPSFSSILLPSFNILFIFLCFPLFFFLFHSSFFTIPQLSQGQWVLPSSLHFPSSSPLLFLFPASPFLLFVRLSSLVWTAMADSNMLRFHLPAPVPLHLTFTNPHPPSLSLSLFCNPCCEMPLTIFPVARWPSSHHL